MSNIILCIILCFIIIILLSIKFINYNIALYLRRIILSDKAFTNYKILLKKYPIIIKKQTPIYIFYHICTINNDNNDNLWMNIVDEQMECLISSGLYDKCTNIFYGCNAKDCDIKLNNYFKKYDKVKAIDTAITPNDIVFENLTVNAMLEFCKSLNNGAYYVYIHTKGITNKSLSQIAWRKYMMYWIIIQHELCIDLLNRGFYTVGTLYSNIIFNHYYAGNFFWVSSYYLRSLTPITNLSNRYNAENFILNKYIPGKHINLTNDAYISYNIFNYKIGLYKYNIDIKPSINNNDVIITIV